MAGCAQMCLAARQGLQYLVRYPSRPGTKAAAGDDADADAGPQRESDDVPEPACFAEGVNAKHEHVGVCCHPNRHAELPGEVIAQGKTSDAAEEGPITVQNP